LHEKFDKVEKKKKDFHDAVSPNLYDGGEGGDFHHLVLKKESPFWVLWERKKKKTHNVIAVWQHRRGYDVWKKRKGELRL